MPHLLLRCCLLLGVAGSWPAQAAAQALPDSSSARPGRRFVPRLPHTRYVVLYDSRYSILNHRFCTINGLKAGVEFKNRFRTGVAIYFLSTGIPTRRASPFEATPGSTSDLRFRYLAGYAEYVLLETPRWELSGAVQLGLGSAYVLYQTPSGSQLKTTPEFLGVTEPSVQAQFKVFRWAGLGAGAGWRQPVFVPAAIQRELNGPVFYVRAKLFLGDFIREIRGHEHLFSQDGLRREQ